MASQSARKRRRLQRAWAAKALPFTAALKAEAAAVPASQYNGIAQQRECIRQMLLRRGAKGASVTELATACAVPSVTKRISELRRQGLDIVSETDSISGPRGVNAAARYVLLEQDSRQGQLDLRLA